MNNKVELLGYYGDDKVHAQSAWTSTSRDLTPEKLERIPKLLNMLASEGHETPFEKSSLHFLVTVDQATHIHLLKHRIGVSINGESARYKELKEDKTYLPGDWNGIGDENDTWLSRLQTFTEEARFFKTFNSQIDMDIMFNFRSFVHFQRLRNSEHAQREVRELAQEMLEIVKNIEGNPFEHTIKAFNL